MPKPSPTHERAWMKVENRAKGIPYGCHIDLDPDEWPDGCVKDYGKDSDCIYASKYRSRERCPWWRKIDPKSA